MTDAIVTAANVDLSNCDREQVQFSGAVQPHGCLLVVRGSAAQIVQASLNTCSLLGFEAAELSGKSLDFVLGARWRSVSQRLTTESLDNGPVHLACIPTHESRSGRALNLFAHRCGGATLLEFEVVAATAERPMLDLYSELRSTIARLQNTRSLRAFFDLAVGQIRHFTSFDRVMAYKFSEDGSGHVIAESALEGLESYLDLHYPASDIPAPARRLFAMAWLRHLPNVDYEPSPIVALAAETNPEPLDLSYSMLRSVSVMYTGYLKNMGVKATMVMPLMKDGKLWGLISAMNHDEPCHVPYESRMAAEFLAHMLSLMMAAKEDAETFEYRLRMRAILDSMMLSLNARSDLHAGLGTVDGSANIHAYLDSGGAALVTEGRITKLGNTPEDRHLTELANWLAMSNELVTATDRLIENYPAAAEFTSTGAGLLAVRLAKRRPEFAMWFRPEQAETVLWAGNPQKPVEIDVTDGSARLVPRGSFAVWKESVQGRSRPWADFEVKAAADLRWAIVEVILERAEETELLNRELQNANTELDNFAYVASHDLKEPLRGIHHAATFMQRQDGDPSEQLETILKLTKRMDDLIESLLQYSRTGSTDLHITDVDLNAVLDEVLLSLAPRIQEANVEIRRGSDLPLVRGDRIRLREVLTNLVSNAIKYNDKPARWVEVGTMQGKSPIIYVRDNGIGIAERHQERIFQIFRRLHGRDEFGGGSGAGLTIVKKTIERHAGRIWLESEPGQGTAFCFTLGLEGHA